MKDVSIHGTIQVTIPSQLRGVVGAGLDGILFRDAYILFIISAMHICISTVESLIYQISVILYVDG